MQNKPRYYEEYYEGMYDMDDFLKDHMGPFYAEAFSALPVRTSDGFTIGKYYIVENVSRDVLLDLGMSLVNHRGRNFSWRVHPKDMAILKLKIDFNK